MFSIILCMLAGIAVGFFLRQRQLLWIDRVMLYIIWLLLFELGIEVGGNDKILSSLPTLGLSALIIAVVAILGSCIAAFGLAKWVGIQRNVHNNSHIKSGTPEGGKRLESPLKGSLIILAFFTFGCIIGYFDIFGNPPLLKEISFYTLSLLIVFVGISIGHNRKVVSNLKSLDRRLLFLPLFTIVGTLAAIFLLWAIIEITAHSAPMSDRIPSQLSDFLAISSGQAYYSLSSVLITQSRTIELGTIALLANIIRELLTLLTAPFLARIFGPLAPISAGGATTADTTLPIITRVCGSDWTILSIYHGFMVDLSVPFMVTLFCSL